jgi:hypothetical protein
MGAYQSFDEMPVWQKAHKLAVEVFHVSEGFPRKEDYGLTSQLRRAALSIPANIAACPELVEGRPLDVFITGTSSTSTTTVGALPTKPRATFCMPERLVTSKIRPTNH